MKKFFEKVEQQNIAINGYVRMKQLAGPNGHLGYSRSKIYQDIRLGRFPPPIKINRVSVWRLSDIAAFIEKMEAKSCD